jgi:hypothetical protein
MVERIQGDAAYGTHLAAAVSIAREHRLGRLLTTAGQLLSACPALVCHADAAAVLEAANEHLAADDYENLAIVRAHLAWTPPASRSAHRVQLLSEEARAFADKSQSPSARAALNDARLYFSGGPDSLEQAERIAQEIEYECVKHPELATHARCS